MVGRVALVATALALLTGMASAHSLLVRASPAARATLSTPPARVQLWFTERLERAYSTVSVTRHGERVDHGDVTVGLDDGKVMSVGIPALAEGVYVVTYRVLSVDGHVVDGSYSFTVARQAQR